MATIQHWILVIYYFKIEHKILWMAQYNHDINGFYSYKERYYPSFLSRHFVGTCFQSFLCPEVGTRPGGDICLIPHPYGMDCCSKPGIPHPVPGPEGWGFQLTSA